MVVVVFVVVVVVVVVVALAVVVAVVAGAVLWQQQSSSRAVAVAVVVLVLSSSGGSNCFPEPYSARVLPMAENELWWGGSVFNNGPPKASHPRGHTAASQWAAGRAGGLID